MSTSDLPLVSLGQGDYLRDIFPHDLTPTPTTTTMKNILTYSALKTFRNCPRKYKHRYLDQLRRPERPDALAFGSIIHSALERWHRQAADQPTTTRLELPGMSGRASWRSCVVQCRRPLPKNITSSRACTRPHPAT